MKKGLSTILFGSVLLFGALLASCSETEGTGEEPAVNGERTLTFTVSSKFEDVDESARSVEAPDTIVRELPNGLVMKAVLEEDRTVGSRAAEDVADGTQVLAIVVNNDQSKVHSVQTVTVENGTLTVSVPDDRDVYIVFYSYNSTTWPTTQLKPGDDIGDDTVINTVVNTGDGGLDAMMCETGKITPTASDLNTVLFRHVFARIKATVTTTSDASLNYEDVAVNGIKFSIQAAAEATVKKNRSFSPVGDHMYSRTTDSISNTKPSLSTYDLGFIPCTSSTHLVRLEQVTLTVPIDIPSESGSISLNSTNWAVSGNKSYHLKISLHCTDHTSLSPTSSLEMYRITAGIPCTNIDDIRDLLATPHAIFGGVGPAYTVTAAGFTLTQSQCYWVIKREFRSETNKADRYWSGNAYVTPGVKASGKYEMYYGTPVAITNAGWAFWGAILVIPLSIDNTGLTPPQKDIIYLHVAGPSWRYTSVGHTDHTTTVTAELWDNANPNHATWVSKTTF